jgi:hypothetical protein
MKNETGWKSMQPKPIDFSSRSAKPQVMLSYIRNAKTGALDDIRTVDFEPGLIIERCGKRYQLRKDGSQKRI